MSGTESPFSVIVCSDSTIPDKSTCTDDWASESTCRAASLESDSTGFPALIPFKNSLTRRVEVPVFGEIRRLLYVLIHSRKVYGGIPHSRAGYLWKAS